MQQYPIIIPKTHTNIKYEVMKFNIPLKNEFIPNLPGKIYRQNEYAEAAGDKKSQPRPEENNADGGEEPKFGAGSSYSHFMRGDKKHKFEKRATTKSDDKTWMMNLGTGKSLRSYKGTKEGNMGENSSYYVFMQSADGSAFEAYPISTWYSFTPVPKHKTLDYDEAENEFLRRDKVLNYFSIMIQKRLMTSQGKQDLINEEEELKNSGLKNNKRIAVDKDLLTIRDVDLTEFEADDREHDGSELDDSETIKDGSKSKPRSKKLQHKGMKKKEEEEKDEEHEPLEESDDGDVEGQEMDYMSSTSSDSSYSPTAPNNANKNIAKHDSQVRNKDDPSLTEPMEELQDYETELIGVADELGLKELHFDSEDDDEEKEGMENNLEKALSKNENIENVGNTELLKVAEGVDIMGVGKDKKTGSKKNKKVKKERPVKYAKNQAESNKLYNEEMIDGGNVSSSDNNSSVNSNGSLSSSGTESSSISSSTNDSDIEIDDNNIRSSIFLQMYYTKENIRSNYLSMKYPSTPLHPITKR
ncbi:general transcription factor IIF subunit 1-like isoform X2 [Gordionus sp. m RMFG-2023]|uniref:general transcription factor IIF subunit 1-like isoform X2 n=1 Tax=Gordionus sp. m RMFG-2023 TaxID=3053472 RepID=UPI0031FD8EFC